MKEVKEYYDKYNYPLVNLYTKKQIKNHDKLITKILSYGKIDPTSLKNKKVLDAGCGTGEKSIFFAKNKAIVTGIDLSTGQLKVAKEVANKNKLNITFKQKDILNDSLKDLGLFDLIVCTGVLHHTEDAYKGFKQLLPILKRKGIIIIALYHKYSRLKYRLIRFFIHTFISKDPVKLDYYFQNNFFFKVLKKAPKNSIYDRYLVPYESYHTIKEVKNWFLENNIKLISFSKEFKKPEIFNIFNKKTLFFISGTKK
jgi:2-polyprenyl-3-methyl-5-hydroxy-6-metoxy-1,4-benzoquinol methylase